MRHGESAPHVDGESFDLVGGHGDPPLAPEGVEQAALAAQRLIDTGERIAAVYVTTLQRTVQTAAPLVEQLGLTPIVEADLREVFLGDWEGGEFRKRVADGDPIASAHVRRAALGRDPRWRTCPSVPQRVQRGIERIAAAHPDELVVAVVHGGVIGEVMNMATGSTGFALHRRRQRLDQPHRRHRRSLGGALLERHLAPEPHLQHRRRTADLRARRGVRPAA